MTWYLIFWSLFGGNRIYWHIGQPKIKFFNLLVGSVQGKKKNAACCLRPDQTSDFYNFPNGQNLDLTSSMGQKLNKSTDLGLFDLQAWPYRFGRLHLPRQIKKISLAPRVQPSINWANVRRKTSKGLSFNSVPKSGVYTSNCNCRSTVSDTTLWLFLSESLSADMVNCARSIATILYCNYAVQLIDYRQRDCPIIDCCWTAGRCARQFRNHPGGVTKM